MLNEEFLTGLLGNEEVSAEDKIKQIIAEHEADTRGLLQKRDELLGSEKKLKEQIAAYGSEKEGYEKRIAELDEALKKASSEDNRKYYETQIADTEKKFKAEIEKLTADRDHYKQSHLNSLREKAIEEGTKELNFVPGLKQGFIARVLAMNDFQPTDIDGNLKFLNKEHHTIEEAINAFALTQEGKAYIANPSTGGGARGSNGTLDFGSGKQITSQQVENMTDEQLMDFSLKGGQVV